MAGRGAAPKVDRVDPKPGLRGDVTAAVGVGWQHGERPEMPEGLMPASESAWSTWFDSWFAAFWSPSDVPGLRQLIRLFDQVERGEFQRASEMRLQMDTYGITPKGQQDRRWKPPVEAESVKPAGSTGRTYGALRSVG